MSETVRDREKDGEGEGGSQCRARPQYKLGLSQHPKRGSRVTVKRGCRVVHRPLHVYYVSSHGRSSWAI